MAKKTFKDDTLYVVYTEDNNGNKNSNYVTGELILLLYPIKEVKPTKNIIDYVMEHTPWIGKKGMDCIDTDTMYDISTDGITIYAFGWK